MPVICCINWYYISEKFKNTFFVSFLLCYALIPLHELVFWGERFRLWILEISPNLFFIAGNNAYFIEGALLYLFVKSLLLENFSVTRKTLYHLLPLVIYVLFMGYTFYEMDYIKKVNAIFTQHIAYSSPYLYFDAIGRFIRLTYAFICMLLIFKYTKLLKQTYGSLQHTTLKWLNVFVISILVLFSWDAALLALKLYYLQIDNFNLDLLQSFGTSAYHLSFIVLNLLIFLKFSIFSKVDLAEDINPENLPLQSTVNVDPKQIAHIEKIMHNTKIYCQTLTLHSMIYQMRQVFPQESFPKLSKSNIKKTFMNL